MVSIGNFRSVNTLNNLQTQKQNTPKQVSFGMDVSNSMIIMDALKLGAKNVEKYAAHHPQPYHYLIEAINKGEDIVSKGLKEAVRLLTKQLAKSNAELRPGLFNRTPKTEANHLNWLDAQRTVGDALAELMEGRPKHKVMRHFDRISDTSKYPDPDFSKMFS